MVPLTFWPLRWHLRLLHFTKYFNINNNKFALRQIFNLVYYSYYYNFIDGINESCLESFHRRMEEEKKEGKTQFLMVAHNLKDRLLREYHYKQVVRNQTNIGFREKDKSFHLTSFPSVFLLAIEDTIAILSIKEHLYAIFTLYIPKSDSLMLYFWI